MNVISTVVNKDLCIGCGVCSGLCPSQALTMHVSTNGDLAPRWDESLCRPDCKLCISFCPFSNGVHDPRPLNEELFSSTSGAVFDDNIGWHLASYAGYRSDESLRGKSASGGLLTACLEILLEEKIVDRIAVVRRSPFDSEQLFEFYGAATIEELHASAGSIYHPVSIGQLLREIKKKSPTRWAIVGVPCLCAAIRGLKHLRSRIPVVLGTACGMYQNTFYTELLAEQSGIPHKQLGEIRYRIKNANRPPNDYAFQAKDKKGSLGAELHYRGLPCFLGRHAFFRFNACNFCKDVFAEAADAVFMDAWLPAYRHDPRGTSFVVIRNAELNDMLLQGQSVGGVQIKQISPEDIVLSQKGHKRRKRELIYMRQKVQELMNVSITKPTMAEKMNWWLQRRIQRRSKTAWAKYGRKYGRFAFWLALTDLLLMLNVIKYVQKLSNLPKRLAGKFRRVLLLPNVNRS
jgi:coenzyme F420-reducing hydrogenase beta subunit